MARTINFNINYPDGTPWVEAQVAFSLSRDDYTATIQYPSFQVMSDATDAAGEGSIDLWQNEEGLATEPTSYYVCTLPSGETFRFTVPTGTTDLELGTLRAAY